MRGVRGLQFLGLLILAMVIFICAPAGPAFGEDLPPVDGIRAVGVHWMVKEIAEKDSNKDMVYTGDENGVQIWKNSQGFSDFGHIFYVSAVNFPQLIPLYQSYNPSLTNHLYTTDLKEAQLFAAPFGKFEGIMGYIAPPGSTLPGLIPLHRYDAKYGTFTYLDIDNSAYTYINQFPRVYKGVIGKAFNQNEGYGYGVQFVEPVIGPPAPLAGTTVTAVSGTEISLAWQTVDVPAFRLRSQEIKIERRSGDSQFAEIARVNTADKKYSDKGLTPGVEYHYRMAAFNEWGDGPYSNEVYVTTPAVVSVTFPNGGESLGSNEPTKIVWGSSAPGVGYINIYYSVDEGLTWKSITTVPVNNTGEFSWSPPNTPTSRARIRVDWQSGLLQTQSSPIKVWSQDKSNGNFIIAGVSGPAPEGPSNLTATAAGPGQVNLEWKDNSPNETGFTVERKNAGGTAYGLMAALGSNKTAYTDTSVVPRTAYTYRIRSWAGAKPSVISNEVNVTTPASNLQGMLIPKIPLALPPLPVEEENIKPTLPPLASRFRLDPVLGRIVSLPAPKVPADFKVEAAGSFSVGLSWQDQSSNETGFKLERKDVKGIFKEVAALPANAIGYIDRNVEPGTVYLYRIKSYNGTGSSAYSSEVRAETLHLEELAAPPAEGTTVVLLKIGDPNYFINQKSQVMDSPPLVVEGRTLMPVRYVVEALGGTVAWDGVERKAVVTLGDRQVEAWVGKSAARVNGAQKPIDANNPNVYPIVVPPGRTMLPLRFITENLGCQVDWSQATQQITITYVR